MSPVYQPRIMPLEACFIAFLTAAPSPAGQDNLCTKPKYQLVDISRPATPSHTLAFRRLRTLTGLSKTRLSEMLCVDRRTPYNWEDGKPISPSNEAHLGQILAALEPLEEWGPESIRGSMLSIDEIGVCPLDRFREGQYQEATARMITALENGGRSSFGAIALGHRDLAASLRVSDLDTDEDLPMTSKTGIRLRIAGKVIQSRD